MKKLINDKNNIVEEVVQGMIKAFPDKLSRVENEPIVIRKNKKVDKVNCTHNLGHKIGGAVFL